jgi:hypothetical protein
MERCLYADDPVQAVHPAIHAGLAVISHPAYGRPPQQPG